MRAVLTRDEMRAADAAAPAAVVARDAGAAGRARRWRTARCACSAAAYGRRVVVVAGKGSNGADGRVAAAVLARRGARVTVLEAEGAPAVLPPCDLVIDAAYGTGFRGATRRPRRPGAAVLAVDIPSGVDADTRRGAGRRACGPTAR